MGPPMRHSIQELNGPTPYPTATTTIVATILIFVFGLFIFDFGENKGIGYLENVFKCENECEFYIFGDLSNGQSLCPPPQPKPITRPTHHLTPCTTPNPREFCFLGGECDYLLNVFEFENEGFDCEFEYEFYIFSDLLNGDTSCGTPSPPPHTTRPTNPTHPSTHQSREFDLFGSEYGCVSSIFEFENFLENGM